MMMEVGDPDASSKRPRGDVGSLLNNTTVTAHLPAHPPPPPPPPPPPHHHHLQHHHQNHHHLQQQQHPPHSPHTLALHRPALPPPQAPPRLYTSSSAPSPPNHFHPAPNSAPPQAGGAYVPPAASYNRAQSEQRPSAGPVPIHQRPGHGQSVTYPQQVSAPPPLDVKPQPVALTAPPTPVQAQGYSPLEQQRRSVGNPTANGDTPHLFHQQQQQQPPPPPQLQQQSHPPPHTHTPIQQQPPPPQHTHHQQQQPPPGLMEHGHPPGYPPQEQQQQQQPPPQHPNDPNHPNYPVHQEYASAHPMTLAPSYAGQPHMYPGPQMQYQMPYGNLQRKKQVRATQACNNCRQRKQKCDEQRPCAFCKENQAECTYKDIPPPKQDRSMSEILSRIAEMQEAIIRMEKRFEETAQGKPVPKQEQRASADPSVPPTSRSDMGEQPAPYISQSHKTSPVSSSSVLSPSSRDVPQTPFGASSQAGAPTTQPMELDQTPSEDVFRIRHDFYGNWDIGELLPDLPQGQETLPERHSTQAHRLLQEWPIMAPFFDKNYSPKDYPAELEMERGTLQLYGRGEGLGVAESEFNEYVAVAASPGSSHSDEVPSHTSSPPQDAHSTGKVALDAVTCERLLQSYLNVMYPMQPFLVKHRIKRLVEKFVKRVNPSSTFSPHPNHRGLDTDSPHSYPALKKRRTEAGFEAATNGMDHQRQPDKNITSAIVLLVLALGEICQYKEPLPAPVKDTGRAYNQSPAASSNVSSPLQHDIRHSHYKSPSGRTDSTPTSEPKRNLDVYPGLRYFAMATEILGGVIAGTDILHAQGFLLAALYEGQLGRVNESWTWIWNAGRVCRLLVRKHESRLKFTQNEPTNNPTENVSELIKWAYWATVQLESDILAEMESFFPTRVTIEESVVAYPRGVYVEPENIVPFFEESPITDLYSAQIMLRRLLNKAHAQLYGITKEGKEDEETAYEPRPAKRIYKLLNELRGIRGMTNSHPVISMRWEDEDNQSTDLNTARMRAKYYGAEYIISRPFLHYAIHCRDREKYMLEEAWRYVATLPRNVFNVFSRPNYIPSTIDERALRTVLACQKCITAAFNSTYAFDKIQGRLMITNIFGTMHAQFGNCLVLAAAYLAGDKQPWLRQIAPQDDVLRVLQRTIEKIGQYTQISPALEVDLAILKRAKQAVSGDKVTVAIPLKQDNPAFGAAGLMSQPMTTHSSFSSAF